MEQERMLRFFPALLYRTVDPETLRCGLSVNFVKRMFDEIQVQSSTCPGTAPAADHSIAGRSDDPVHIGSDDTSCPGEINLILPTPPPLNNLYFNSIIWPKNRSQKPYSLRVLSQAGQDYKKLVSQIVDGHTPIAGDVWVTFRWFRPRCVGDLDGIFKIILDSFSGYLYYDDKQVARIHADRFEDKGHPRVEVCVRPLGLC